MLARIVTYRVYTNNTHFGEIGFNLKFTTYKVDTKVGFETLWGCVVVWLNTN